jgi:alkaline phosphatase
VALKCEYIAALTFASLCQAYNDAFATVLHETGAGGGGFDVRTKNAGATLVVSVADHSTGGLTLGLQTDWEMHYAQTSVCRPGDSCKATLGTYAYDTTDGWQAK